MNIIELVIYTFIFLLFLNSICIYAVCSTTYRIRLETLKIKYENKAKE